MDLIKIITPRSTETKSQTPMLGIEMEMEKDQRKSITINNNVKNSEKPPNFQCALPVSTRHAEVIK